MKHLAALAAVAALAAPAAASAGPGKSDAAKAKAEQKASKGQSKAKNAVFKGSVVSVDAATGTVTVLVEKANKRGRSFKGQSVAFTTAGVKKISGVRDTNADGKKDLADVKAGDAVVAQARVTKDATPPLAARKLNVRSPEADDAAETEAAEQD